MLPPVCSRLMTASQPRQNHLAGAHGPHFWIIMLYIVEGQKCINRDRQNH